jgi:hypothetical protein
MEAASLSQITATASHNAMINLTRSETSAAGVVIDIMTIKNVAATQLLT